MGCTPGAATTTPGRPAWYPKRTRHAQRSNCISVGSGLFTAKRGDGRQPACVNFQLCLNEYTGAQHALRGDPTSILMFNTFETPNNEFDARQNLSGESSALSIPTYEEYARGIETRDGRPYIIELHAASKSLLYFGARHSHDPTDPQMQQIENAFKTETPDLVFVEGARIVNDRPGDVKQYLQRLTRGEVIAKLGESGFAAWLATNAKCDVESPEPPFTDEVHNLLKHGYEKQAIAVFYFYRQVVQFLRDKEPRDFPKYMRHWLKTFRKATGWRDFEYSIPHLDVLGAQIWGVHLTLEPGAYDGRIDPVPWPEFKNQHSVTNRVAATANEYRDLFMVKSIRSALEKRNRLMVVCGVDHARIQSKAVRQLFQQIAATE